MADESNNIVDNWEEIDENELFKETERISEPIKPAKYTQMILQGDDAFRTQYLPPEPLVKILKRPNKDERLNLGSDLQNGAVKQVKSLRQREAEYAEARQRIMGDLNERSERLEVCAGSSRCSSQPASPVYTLLRPPEKLEPNVLRHPRGPDGSGGFTLRR